MAGRALRGMPVSYTHLFETGDYRGAVQDYDVVLKQYPTFLPGFVSRSEAKRKLGDNVGLSLIHI